MFLELCPKLPLRLREIWAPSCVPFPAPGPPRTKMTLGPKFLRSQGDHMVIWMAIPSGIDMYIYVYIYNYIDRYCR